MSVQSNVLIRALTNNSYSGGRLYAWIIAEALAHRGHSVMFWGDVTPVFVSDFSSYPAHAAVQFYTGAAPVRRFDLVLVVPHLGSPRSLYFEALAVAARDGAKLALLNFETPNWFNSMSPEPRNPKLWDTWRSVARHADVVLSASREGTKHAIPFYGDSPEHCQFLTIHPGINSIVADQVTAQRTRQVTCITRFRTGDEYKGATDLTAVLGPYLAGYTLAVIVGSDGVDPQVEQQLRKHCEHYGVMLRVLAAVSDEEKFRELKRSRLLVFLSSFEGFGYPPVEALYCGVPCVAYDLAVLRELGGTGIRFVPLRDHTTLQKAIAEVLELSYSPSALKQTVAPIVGFEPFSVTLNEAFTNVLAGKRRHYRRFLGSYWGMKASWFRFRERMSTALKRQTWPLRSNVLEVAQAFRRKAKI
jgi:glycosyltransferase involved in cell wall biosynthesis